MRRRLFAGGRKKGHGVEERCSDRLPTTEGFSKTSTTWWTSAIPACPRLLILRLKGLP